MIFLFSSL